MKVRLILLLIAVPVLAFGQSYQGYDRKTDRLSIRLSEGILHLIPLSEHAIRVLWEKNGIREEKQFVLIGNPAAIPFKVSETDTILRLSTKALSVYFDKQTSAIEYKDISGNSFLRERTGSRKLIPDSVGGQPCFIAEQSFDSPPDEYLFGLGQFQDGHYNLRNVSRRLLQVNSQIAVPFLHSSKGYGILWHQYGLTVFNPADSVVLLTKKDSVARGGTVAEVTTTAGTQKLSQQQSLYSGKFNVQKNGMYSFMLDMGGMENRYWLVIDGMVVIDQSNLWLPPAVSKLVDLKAGEHTVEIICRSSNIPALSWKPVENGTTFRSPNAKSLDYIVFSGKSADDIIGDYRKLTGTVPLLPLWAYGFWQCRERYTSGDHLVRTVKEFRERKLPVDVIVQDWQYWGKYGWGVPKFDEANYPDPSGFIQQLHDLHARFSLSVWENIDKRSDIAKEYLGKNLYIPNSPWIDIFKPETRQTHWKVLNENLFKHGVDSWWMDATEPENDALAGKQTSWGLGDFYRLVYPFFVSKAVYEGQRRTDPGKRVAILTRSAFAGQQRYGTINWSGDIGWDWDTYKRQILAGLNFSLTGMPYWTTDIGGFFRPGPTQYTDPGYHDILLRWFQWGAFNPVFRIHGYQTETEPWKYGDSVMNTMRHILDLRYRLLPYIYSEGWQIHTAGSTMMRPMVMDFKSDTAAIARPYQYMFGKSFLVAPVTAPGVQQWEVYLPGTIGGWYDFWTGRRFTGGQFTSAAAPPDKIPLFVKAGSIVPMGQFMQYTSEKPMDTLEIRIYSGADGQFTLYNDEGDNYNYEQGRYRLISFNWNEQRQALTINKLQGNYKDAPRRYVFNIVWVNTQQGYGVKNSSPAKTIIYNGERISVLKR